MFGYKRRQASPNDYGRTAIISATQYSGNLEKARRALSSKRYIPNMLSKSQLNRRLLRITKDIWDTVLENLFQKKNGLATEFIVDSFPIPACKLVRSYRAKIPTKKYIGYCAAKKEFFLGLKLHMISDVHGNPKQYLVLPASVSDIEGLRKIDLKLQKNSRLYGDKAYNDYAYEDQLVHKQQIHLLPIQKKNSKRTGSSFLAKIRRRKRKAIETAFSCMEKLMPRSIHAVTKAGFELKAFLFMLAYAFSKSSFRVTT